MDISYYSAGGGDYPAAMRFYSPNTENSRGSERPFLFRSISGANHLELRNNGGAFFAGSVGIGTTSPEAKLEVAGDRVNSAYLRLGNPYTASAYGDWVGIDFVQRNRINQFTGNPAARISSIQEPVPNNTYGLQFWTRNNAATFLEKMRISADGNVGIGTTTPQAKLDVNGNAIVQGNLGIGTTSPQAKLEVAGSLKVSGAGNSITTPVLTITGGSDVAEPFAMSEPDVPQGAVVIIDETQPGRLKLSEQPYDTRVAGIISGAGGVNSGLTLSQQGVLEGGQNVALSGRVYALANATESPIKPGDLLTTSATPGHCMKATDRERRAGAILGKAMSSLPEGKGLVLVLVSLQ
jgi:hypothetical protein